MGAPVAWFEITSQGPARLVEFYRELFDWTADSSDPSYSLIDTGAGEGAIGGVSAQPRVPTTQAAS